MKNILRAKKILEKLYGLGVKDYVICPGGRNAPFVEALTYFKNSDIEVYWGFEERSASFLALGLTLKNNEPVAVFTTSGTAFVETTPALLEAHYSGRPLIVVSSDRPENLWATGAPQTMIQKDFLKSHLGPSFDDSFNPKSVSYPLHLNCSFDEPLIDEPLVEWQYTEKTKPVNVSSSIKLNPYKSNFTPYDFQKLMQNIGLDLTKTKRNKVLFVFSSLSTHFKNIFTEHISKLSADCYFESTAEIEAHRSEINSVDLTKINVQDTYDVVVRVGGIPTHRFWRDFEQDKFKKVIHFSSLPLVGLSYGEVFQLAYFKNFLEDLKSLDLKYHLGESKAKISQLTDEQNFYVQLKEKCVLFNRKNKKANSDTVFYLGNSTPIRFWDLDKTYKFNEVYASRGLNGIDGQISTAIGLSLKSKQQKTIALLGDLTTMYDLSAPWYWTKLDEDSKKKLTLIVINNSGGQIFSKMFDSKKFLNTHDFDFSSWSKMWNLSYTKIKSIDELNDNPYEWPNVIELSSS